VGGGVLRGSPGPLVGRLDLGFRPPGKAQEVAEVGPGAYGELSEGET